MSIVSSRRRRGLAAPSNGEPAPALQADAVSMDLAAPQGPATKRPAWLSWRQMLVERRREQSLLTGTGKQRHPLLWGIGDLVTVATAPQVDVIALLAKAEAAPASSRLLKDLWSPREPKPFTDPRVDGALGVAELVSVLAVNRGDGQTSHEVGCGPMNNTRDNFDGADNPVAALALVAWARNIAGLAEVADEQAWWAMAEHLANLSLHAPPGSARGLLSDQLISVELCLTLAHWLDGCPCAADARHCVSLLEESLLAEVDDDGLVRDVPRQHWLPLLACWTRCRMLAYSADLDLRPDANDRYLDFVESLLRLTGGKGQLVWPGQASAIHQELDLWRAAATFVDPRLRRAVNAVWPNSIAKSPPIPRRATAANLPPSAGRSERAGFAVLRPTWSSPRLTIDYSGPQLHLRLDRIDDVWLDGDCPLHVAIDGRKLAPQSSWEEICWITDDDVDYLELQLDFDEDVRVQRHILFAREDEFIFLADAVLGERPADIEYAAVIPYSAGIVVGAADETRELTLVKSGRRRAVCLPLALGEWRADRGRGEFIAEPEGLRLTQTARQAANLFAPCFIDVSPKRRRRPVTWRRLTVAEERQTQADDAAVGYRVQIGQQQWLFYRSLIACGNRTLLGHNLVSEFLAARFSRKGVPETLIEIEAPADEHE